MTIKTPRVDFACLSDVGRVRQNNEDAFGAFPELGVWCVADGMGGADDGAVASAETIASVASFAADPDARVLDTAGVIAGVCTAVSGASQRLYDRTREKCLSGCGSTFVCLVLGREPGSMAHALHAGDSRLYRVRKGILRRFTRDHSVATVAGVRSERELGPMFRSMITRAVGIERDVSLDDMPFDCRPGDRLILCSDGLTRMVPEAELAVLTSGLSANAAAHALVAAANAAGGDDNVTVIVVDIARPRHVRWLLGAIGALLLLAFLGLVAFFVQPETCCTKENAIFKEEDLILKRAQAMENAANERMQSAQSELNHAW